MYRSETRLYLNRARNKVVLENSPEAAFVLCGAGGEIDDALARRLGLLDPPAQVTEPAPIVMDTAPVNEPEPQTGFADASLVVPALTPDDLKFEDSRPIDTDLVHGATQPRQVEIPPDTTLKPSRKPWTRSRG